MATRVSHTTVNCLNAHELSEWWKRVLDYTDLPGDPNEPGDEECMIMDPRTGHRLLFIEVSDLQDPVGRVHFDLAPVDRTRDEEVERVLGLGAREVADRRRPDGSGWMVLEDPSGNRFCILRSDAERSAQGIDATS
ncbi:MAG: VOC family protein [Actinomycetota bacterium]|nr:VOC family protein [Actinomycetota bacterium]